jgi:hypothetical protein
LPNPTAMNIERIKVFGVGSDIANSRLYMVIGNKIMVDRPLWTTCLRDSFIVDPAMMICPLQAYRAEISWEGRIQLGRSLSGLKTTGRVIQVALLGRIARAIN